MGLQKRLVERIGFSLANYPVGETGRGLILGLIGLLIFFSPYLYLGQDSFWSTSDYLDLVVAWYKVLIDQDAVFWPNHRPVSGLLDELPRGVLASEFFLKTWLFYFFQPFTAILLNKLIIHVAAFFSMYQVLVQVRSKEGGISYSWLYALVWSTCSFWPESGIAVAVLPTVFLVFYKLHLGEKFGLRYFCFILVYSAYTLLHLQGLFLGIGLFIFGQVQILISRRFNSNYWLGFLCFTLLSILFNYRHFLLFFLDSGDFVPHRVEYDIYSFGGFYEEFWPNFLTILNYGQLHSVRFSPLLVPFTLGILLYWKWTSPKSPSRELSLAFNFIWVYLGCTAFAVLSRYIPLIEWFDLSLVKVFAYDRFLVLFFPGLVFSFFLAMNFLVTLNPFGKLLHFLLLVAVLTYGILVLDDNHKNLILKPLTGLGERIPTFRQFYAEKQFEEIRQKIRSSRHPEGKVVSIGIHPSVATYNGLHSLDGYTGNYSLSHKHRFGKIIQHEIQKEGNQSWLYKHFMGWGNKCYLFNSTHQDNFMRMKWTNPLPLERPLYDWDALLEMGGRFVLSTDPIHHTPELSLLGIFDHFDSAWKIYLYELR